MGRHGADAATSGDPELHRRVLEGVEDGYPAAGLGPPVLVIVDADPGAREETVSALVRRFGPDYQVLRPAMPKTAWTPSAGCRSARRGGTGAADLRLPGIGGVEFLQRARALHPGASRVLLLAMDRYHTRVPFTELTTLQRATALGLIDFAVVKGWVTPEEWLYPQVQEALTAWTLAHRPTTRRVPDRRRAVGPPQP